MDEDGALYFTAGRKGRTKLIAGRAFLEGCGGTFGEPENKANRNPFTNTYIKSKGKDVYLLTPNAPIPLDQALARPMDLTGGWLEGAEWMYAGSSPGVIGGCSCPTQRSHLDWYKRSYVPEQYRHSIGILDTNGNVIMHLGQYGNYDSGQGPKSAIPVGDGIVMSALRFVSGTDNYLCYEDNGERLVVLKLNYHTEETAGISNQ
jgi:hypothetical protein